MIRVNLYTAKGIKKSSINLPKKFSEKENFVLLAQALRVYEARKHPGLSKVKSRGEVSLTTRKLYRQKGTGRARHGARSAPIFVGGGVAHGPKGVKRELSLPKKMRQKALNIALSLKAQNGEVVAVSGLDTLKKTKEAKKLIDSLLAKEKKEGKKTTFVLSEASKNASLALRNIKGVAIVDFKSLNAYQVYFGGVLVVDKKAIAKTQKGKHRNSKRTQGYKNP
ncbi:50S ribosomal protein L4 [Patescibacteria group bacterium]|nr:50S ribosomal protein L4 [Patescibacteria group bacterium]